jgi:hypothetical protein
MLSWFLGTYSSLYVSEPLKYSHLINYTRNNLATCHNRLVATCSNVAIVITYLALLQPTRLKVQDFISRLSLAGNKL